MKLVDMTVRDYLDLLKSDAPAPGGGSVSALSAAQGVGLVAMVADLTIGREKYAEYEQVCKEAKEEALKLYEALVAAIDEDTEAFNKVSAAYKMPKDTDEQKAARSAAIRKANVGATQVPYETIKLCLAGLKVTETMVGKSNPNAASDLGVAALNLMAGIRGAWLNVKINLPGIKDEAAKAQFEKGAEMVDEAYVLASRIYEEVLTSL
ncbi:MAG: cyclodeaminase/cyclohydrolase family protein [Anaerovoracaceae bacterium]|nr:cyclodeaminase/cyclohydrolase family protein [Anaerovoracaceae bacterium]